MKILVGYDGSVCADAALSDLVHAGLPGEAEAVVFSVSELALPPPMSHVVPNVSSIELQKVLDKNALVTAERAGERLRKLFPHWSVRAEVQPGSPASTLISRADEWQPDLIVMGSHGRSAVGRLFLGSVSQAALHEAHGSVRIARCREIKAGYQPEAARPVRLIVGVDGSEIANAAVAALASRTWPAGSQVRIVHADFNISAYAEEHMMAALHEWIAEERGRVLKAIESAIVKLRAAGLETSYVVKQGEAKEILLNEAEGFDADCIFLGAKNLGRAGRLRLGSVSSAVAARARCTVEIVRVPAKK